MTTYTIAMIGDMLAATAPDGDDALMESRLAETFGELNADGEAPEVVYYDGLTLYTTEGEAEEAGAEIIYSGIDMGWLQDADGNMEYQAAGRVEGGAA